MEKIQLISGRGNPVLAQKISQYLKVPLSPVIIKNFANGEIYVKIEEKVRGNDVFVIQTLSSPVNENLMELLIMIDALHRASAERINVVCPLLCYSRQDRKTTSREPITAKLVANLITKAGADRLLTVDLHADQIQGFYDIPLDNLYSAPFVSKKIFSGYPNMLSENLVVMSPDAGGAGRAKTFIHEISKVYNITPALVIGYKERPSAGDIDDYKILGNVAGKDVMIIDDILDSGKTLVKAAENLKAKGANKIYAYVTHSLFTNGIEPLKKNFEKIFVSNTRTIDIKDEKLEIIDLSDLFAEGIYRTAEGESLSQLFE